MLLGDSEGRGVLLGDSEGRECYWVIQRGGSVIG